MRLPSHASNAAPSIGRIAQLYGRHDHDSACSVRSRSVADWR